MINVQEITPSLKWIGGNDRRLALFENLFPLPNGISYNSYVLTDEKTVLFDTADSGIAEQFTENLKACLEGRTLDYLVVLHMEPDHCSLLKTVLGLYPDVTIVTSAKAKKLILQFFPELCETVEKAMIVQEGDTLSVGSHTLRFIGAPMVHWPEVLMAYEETEKILFSADAFGTFGAIDGSAVSDKFTYQMHYIDEARRYYTNIVGKYGQQVQAVLKKAAGLEIQTICSLHGPVWKDEILPLIIEKYDKWSSYTPEDPEDTVIIYGTMYGHTGSAAETVATKIRERGKGHVAVYDVSETDVSYLIAEIFRCGRLVIISPTYNNGIYAPIHALLQDMKALFIKGRKVAVGQNGSWAPSSGKQILEELACMKDMTVSENMLTILSALHKENEPEVDAFVDAFLAL